MSCNCVMLIIIVLLILAIIYVWMKNDKLIPNDGSVKDILKQKLNSMRSGKNTTTDQSVQSIRSSQAAQSNLINDLLLDIGPSKAANGSDVSSSKYSEYTPDQYIDSNSSENPNRFTYKKKEFVKQDVNDIKKQFDVTNYLPKQTNNDWFEVLHNDVEKVNNPNLINMKPNIGQISSAGSKRNMSHDIRGDIPNPKLDVFLINGSTIEPSNFKGLCG